MFKGRFEIRKKIKNIVCAFLILTMSIQITSCQIFDEGGKEAKIVEIKTNIDSREFIDSTGRKVELPKEIKAVVPSGKVAQMMIAMVSPDSLISLVDSPRKMDLSMPKGLPITGQYYSGNGDMNIEEIIKLKPDVIIDIGEPKKNIKKDMDELQEITKIPTIFINSELFNTAKAFRILGELLNSSEKGEALAKFTDEALEFAKEGSSKIENPKTIYQTSNMDGTGADLDGTLHAEIINLIGGKNAAKVKAKGGKPSQQVYMEDIMLWNPDIIITSNWEGEKFIKNRPEWKEIDAVKNNQVFLAPLIPYSWISQPPSANRIIGIYWMAEIVYPEIYSVNLKEKTKEWYKLAYSYELTDNEYEDLFKNPLDK